MGATLRRQGSCSASTLRLLAFLGGNRRLSQVPELSLWTHALLCDPGGALKSCQFAFRAAAFRFSDSVGFLRLLPDYPFVHNNLLFRGSITRPAFSLHPVSYSHYWFCTWISLLTCWLGFRQMGLELYREVQLSPIGQH
jgi:hypothetical protein